MKNSIFLIIHLITLINVLYSCHSKDMKHEDYIIDPNRKDQVSISDFFSKIEIIPLETSEQSLLTFLIGEPDKVVKYNNNFFVLDRDQEAIIVFNLSGKFIKRISKKGQGPGEYISINDFNINRYTNNLEILSPEGRCINIYDSQSDAFIKKIQLPHDLPVVHQFHHLTPDIYAFASYAGDFKIYFYSLRDNKIIESDYQLPKWLNRGTTLTPSSRNPFYVYNDTLCFEQIYNGDVFTISTDNYKLSPRYTWNFGKFKFDPSILPENETTNFYLDLLKKISADYAILFQIYQENDNYYFTRFKFKNRYKHLILDKHTQKNILFEHFKEGGQCLPQLIDENAIYTFISPSYLHHAIKPSMLDEVNQQTYSLIKDDDNPVIIKYSLK